MLKWRLIDFLLWKNWHTLKFLKLQFFYCFIVSLNLRYNSENFVLLWVLIEGVIVKYPALSISYILWFIKLNKSLFFLTMKREKKLLEFGKQTEYLFFNIIINKYFLMFLLWILFAKSSNDNWKLVFFMLSSLLFFLNYIFFFTFFTLYF